MEQPYEFHTSFNDKYSVVMCRLSRLLSEDSRRSISELSESLGISRQTTTNRIRHFEEELNVHYTLELNEEKLGLEMPHIIVVKFTKKPDYEYIKKLFLGSYIPQFVAVAEGGYDMLIYANAFSRSEYVHWDKSMQILLSKYGTYWQPSEIAHRQLHFFPIRSAAIEKAGIGEREKRLLVELNENSRISFQRLSEKMQMKFTTVEYTFKKLLKAGYIRRFTISAEPNGATIVGTFGKYTISEKFEDDAAMSRKAFMSDDELPILSRYWFAAQLIGSYDFFSLGMFDDIVEAKKHNVAYYKATMAPDKVRVKFATLKGVILGRLPARNVDNKKEYNIMKWIPEIIG